MENVILGKMFDVGNFAKSVIRKADFSDIGEELNNTMMRVIIYIKNHPGCSMSETSGKIGIEKSSFTRVIDKLGLKGIVATDLSQSDRRKTVLWLTEYGLGLAEELSGIIHKFADDYFNRLPKAQLKKLEEHLASVLSILSSLD